MKLLLILSSIFLSSTLYSQGYMDNALNLTGVAAKYPQFFQDTVPEKADTITLSVTHQTLLPQLIGQQAWLSSLKQPGAIDAALADIAEKINILLTAYIDPKAIQDGKVQLGPDQKSIIVR